MYNNTIPHTWKANIMPIRKPNKDINIGTSYRPISLPSVIAIALEKTLLPYVTNNISTQNGFKSNHYTSTALHNINKTIATGFNQNTPPERTITVALDMSKAFDTHSHTHTQTTQNKHPTPHYLIHRKLHQKTQSIHHMQKQNINTTPIQKWCSIRRRSITYTLQHIHI